jgi:hypothetical protein
MDSDLFRWCATAHACASADVFIQLRKTHPSLLFNRFTKIGPGAGLKRASEQTVLAFECKLSTDRKPGDNTMIIAKVIK